MAYILGHREFWSLTLRVTSDTLIPRPETELLVETALEAMVSIPSPRVLDLGTGSGAIALAIGSERADATVVATDQSARALDVAESNRTRVGLENVSWLCSNWFDSVASRFHIIISNPPYLAPDDPHLQQGDLRYEPSIALVADNSGLADVALIVAGARQHLLANGWLGVEHGYQQAEAVRRLMHANGFRSVNTKQDLAGQDRMTYGVLRHE